MEACKIGSSERHNEREKDLDYVRKDLSYLNEKEVIESISNRIKSIRKLYHETFGQNMQSSAKNIQEIVLRINQDTTLEQVKRFGELCQQAYGLTPLQYYVHKDEGHYDVKSGEWIPNLHAHIVVDVTCYEHKMVRAQKKSHGNAVKDEKGKPIYVMKDAFCNTIKFSKKDMSKMQDLAAKATGMQRGTPSSVKHLDAIQYKLYQKELDLKSLQHQIDNISLSVSEKGQLAADAFKDKITRILGKSKVELRNEELIEENSRIKAQMDQEVTGLQQMQRQLEATKQLLASRYETEAKKDVFEEIFSILLKYSESICEAFRKTKVPDLQRVAAILEKSQMYINQTKQQMAQSDIERIATKQRSMEIGKQKAEQESGVMRAWLKHEGAPEEAAAEARHQIQQAQQSAQKWKGRAH